MYDCLIVGSGMTGISAARELKKNGKSVIILDKGSRPGGRMSTRPIYNQMFDHGAQYFSVNTSEFEAEINKLLESKIVKPWFTLEKPRYVGSEGMNTIPKELSAELEIVQKEKVEKIDWSEGVFSANGYQAKTIILTPPVPQSLEVFDNSGLALSNRAELDELKYDPCIAVLVVTKNPFNLPIENYIRNTDPEAFAGWITDNRLKLDCRYTEGSALTVHLSAKASTELFDLEKEEIAETTIKKLGLKDVLDVFVHRWKYALPKTTTQTGFMKLEPFPGACVAGEIFYGAKVEGAFMSGLLSAREILKNK